MLGWARLIEAHAGHRGPTQVDLPLSDRRSTDVAMKLRELGFFFGALLPEFHRGDVLRMQHLPRRPHSSEVPALESEALQAIAEFVARDFRVTASPSSGPSAATS